MAPARASAPAVLRTPAAPGASQGPAFAGVWFRRALRLDDNAALIAATDSGEPVLPFYILDPDLEVKVRAS